MAGVLLIPPVATEAKTAYTRVEARHSRRCLDVRAKSKSDGAIVQQYRCQSTKAPHQRWHLVPAGGGYYYFVNRNSGKCLDIKGASTASRAYAQQYTCKGGDNQKFKLVTARSGGWYNIVAKHSSKCLDVKSSGRGDRAIVQQYDCKNTSNQQWRLRVPK
jgi:hypothetical protein